MSTARDKPHTTRGTEVTPTEEMIREFVDGLKAKDLEGYQSTHEKLLWVDHNVLDMIDIPSSPANQDFAEDCVEQRVRYYLSAMHDQETNDYYSKKETKR